MILKERNYDIINEAEEQLCLNVINDQPVENEHLIFPSWDPPLVKGIHKIFTGIFIRLHIILIAFKIYINPYVVIKVLKGLEYLRRQYMGDFNIKKIFKVDGRYYWDMHAPGWPSKAFIKYNEGEMNRIFPFRPKTDYLNSMIFAITKKCPLKCLHCYEWNELNHKDTLSLSDLKSIIRKFQSRGKGVAQIQFSGGEPLSRYEDVLDILESSMTDTDFWIVTSGYKLTKQKARTLKNAGLRGVSISLDHFNPSKHNRFRGTNDSFNWVLKAIRNAHSANLMVILSLCAIKTFVSKNNLIQYANLAKRLGVAYILIIEPRAVGRYKDMDIALSQEQLIILEDFYLKMNFDPSYSDMSAVSYHGYHQRRIGCFGGGNRYVYVNTNGNLQVCPFCQQKYGSALKDPIDECTAKMKTNGCQPYKQAIL
jgi:MoaA/NifB/PqqE/SkfB family radical SAM enzyme